MTWLPYNDGVLQFAGEKISKTTLGFEMLSEPKRKMIKHMKVEEVKNVALKRDEEMQDNNWKQRRQALCTCLQELSIRYGCKHSKLGKLLILAQV